MEQIKFIIRTNKTKGNIRMRFRLVDGRSVYLYHKSSIIADLKDLEKFNEDGTLKSGVRVYNHELQQHISDEIRAMQSAYLLMKRKGSPMNSEQFEFFVADALNGDILEDKHQVGFFEAFAEFIEGKKISKGNKSHYWVLYRTLQRFELYSRSKMEFETLSPEKLRQFEKYLVNEHDFFEKAEKAKRHGTIVNCDFLKIIEAVPDSRKPVKRGQNTIHNLMKKFCTFIRWANGLDKDFVLDSPYTNNNPFRNYSIVPERYGTPVFITTDERNRLYRAELPDRLQKQRDIFVFQCAIGCRVSDLWSMTKSNVIDGAIEYIQHKTRGERPVTVRVPLINIAKEIVEKYKDLEGERLFPFTSQQHYNIDIKEMFRLAKIDRIVTVINPVTGEDEKVPIYEVASSHMARRAFIGNLYNKVQDPNLIGSMSGHVEGSRAFARYRDIGEELKKETVALLE